ncbi:17452_t:CDS:2, partial [Dentiscutata erythropus]
NSLKLQYQPSHILKINLKKVDHHSYTMKELVKGSLASNKRNSSKTKEQKSVNGSRRLATWCQNSGKTLFGLLQATTHNHRELDSLAKHYNTATTNKEKCLIGYNTAEDNFQKKDTNRDFIVSLMEVSYTNSTTLETGAKNST